MPRKAPTDQQLQEAVDTFAVEGSKSAAARSLKMNINTYKHWLGLAESRDIKSKLKAERVVVDNGQVVGTSTLYDADGDMRLQWVKERPEDVDRQEKLKAWLEGLKATLPRTKAVSAPKHPAESLLACYPVGDHHFGMLAWSKETGADHDTAIGEALLRDAMAHLVKAVPSCAEAVIALLGDFLHYDSMDAVTPASKNQLDSDSRYPKIVRVALQAVRLMITKALQHHGKVKVIIEIGNHDLVSSIWLMEALALIYENEPRVTIDTSPRHFHYHRFGKCLIATHHGHGVKLQDLPLLMATDRPEDWGATDHRYWYTGHVHHDQAKDFNGVSVESFRILPPADAYAANKGYRSRSDMKAIVLHKEFGEVARHAVSPRMLA